MSRARLLLITPEGDISAEFELKESNVVIGRSPQANVIIADSDVSRSHAQIVNTEHGFFVADMGSTNGTFLNGVPIEPKQMFQLKSNDQVNLGRVSLLFQVVSDSLPSINKSETTIRFPNNNYQTSNASPAAQPVYIPQAEHLNIEVKLEEEELELARQIFGDKPNKPKGNSWNNLFKAKTSTKEASKETSFDNWSEEELFNEILGSNQQQTPKDNYPVLYKPQNNGSMQTQVKPTQIIKTKAVQSLETEIKPNTISNIIDFELEIREKPISLSYQAASQAIPAEEHAYIIDTESFYYPQVDQDAKKFAPQAYSYNAEPNGRDPFADLNFRDNDSLLSKFNNYQSKAFEETNLDFKVVLQKFVLPFGLIIGAAIIAFGIYFTNSGVFG